MKTFLFGVSFLLMAAAVQAQSVFTSPLGGEEIVAGSTRTISWDPKLVTGMLTLSLWDGARGSWQNVFTNVPAEEGKISWAVPNDLSGNKFRIKLSTSGSMKGSALTRTFFSIQPASKTEARSEAPVNVPMLTVHPNPAFSQARICVPDLPAGTPVTMIVVNSEGEVVSTLYNATPDAELGLCCTLDCSTLPDGVYFARLWNDILGQSIKLIINH